MFRITFNKLFKWLFYRVFAFLWGGPGSFLGRDMSGLGLLV